MPEGDRLRRTFHRGSREAGIILLEGFASDQTAMRAAGRAWLEASVNAVLLNAPALPQGIAFAMTVGGSAMGTTYRHTQINLATSVILALSAVLAASMPWGSLDPGALSEPPGPGTQACIGLYLVAVVLA